MAESERTLAKLAFIAAGKATEIEAAAVKRRASAAARSALGISDRGSLAISDPDPASRPPDGRKAGSGDCRPVRHDRRSVPDDVAYGGLQDTVIPDS
jgi:hypothetical protein